MQAVAESGAGMSGASAVHISIFAPRVIVKHGSEEQRRRFLPPLIDGRDICAFGVTEPDAGLDTTRITTFARRRGAGYVISGRKVWTSLAQVATRILLLGAHHAAGRLRQADRRHEPLLCRVRPRPHRGAGDREDGPGRRRFEPGLHRRSGSAGSRPHRRGGHGLPLYPGEPQPRAHPDRRRGHRASAAPHCAGRPNMPRSGWSSAGPSARTRRSSIPWPRAGWSWRRPTS